MRVELFSQLGAADTPVDNLLENPEDTYFVNFIDEDDDVLDHGVGHILDELFLRGLVPSEVAIDLLLVAATVNAADTKFRRQDLAEDKWTRQMSLHIPVSEPGTWTGAAPHLSRMLKFLTGDLWTFHFRGRPDDYDELAEAPTETERDHFDLVALFSGGLDSLIGAIDTIGGGHKPLLISHYWDGETSAAQSVLLDAMFEHFGDDRFDSIRARIGFDDAALSTSYVEPTQRARSFLFYSMAAVAADALPHPDKVVIPENGLIALNVPLDPLRLGALSTRTAHPFFIECMGELAARVGVASTFETPYRFRTKGEMVSKCGDVAFLKQVVPESMSCSSPAKVRWHGATPQHCGHCVPCLIRRAALHAGLPGNDATAYFLDELRGGTLDSKRAEGKDIRSFLFAAETLAKNPSHARSLVRKPGPLPAADVDAYADVYARGMKEIAAFLKGVRVKH